jgi:hypothetical protein
MRAFALLAHHFFGRFFDNEIVSQQGDMRTNVVQVLGFLAVPGMFAAFSMLPVGLRYDQPFAGGWQLVIDDYFFVLYSMVVMGFVMVFEWDSLFPDRKDYIILTPLPLGGTAIFLAKLAALVAFLALFVLDANFLGALLTPLVTGGSGTAGPVVWRIALAHMVAVSAGGLFVALVFAGLQGLLINVLTGRAFRRISPWVQMASMGFLIAVLFLTPMIAINLRALFEERSPLLHYFPPFWFLALYMDNLPGRPAGAVFHGLAPLARQAVWIAGAVFAVTYLAGYWRHARRVMDSAETAGEAPGPMRVWLEGWANRLLLPHPLERATFHFISNTILRSARHRLLLATYGGITLAVALPGVLWLETGSGRAAAVFSAEGLLAVPLTVTFFCITGLRAAFNLPAELRANWIFQVCESEERVPHIRAARKWIVAMGLAPAMLLLAPIEIWFRGWLLAAVHLGVALLLALILLDLLLIWFRKIPFSCAYFPGKKSMAGMAALYLMGFLAYRMGMAALERRWIASPWNLVVFFAVATGALAGLSWLERRELGIDDVLIYEDQPDPVVRSLELG